MGKSVILSTFQTFTCRCSEHESMLVLTSFSRGLQQIVCRWMGRWWLCCTCSAAWLNPQMMGLRPHYPQNGAPTVPSLGRAQSLHLPLRSPGEEGLSRGTEMPLSSNSTCTTSWKSDKINSSVASKWCSAVIYSAVGTLPVLADNVPVQPCCDPAQLCPGLSRPGLGAALPTSSHCSLFWLWWQMALV